VKRLGWKLVFHDDDPKISLFPLTFFKKKILSSDGHSGRSTVIYKGSSLRRQNSPAGLCEEGECSLSKL